MNERERFDALLDALDDLREANESTPILVEGQRDVAALRALGFTGELLPVHNGSPLYNLAEEVARERREVILLTDWDRTGGLLRDRLQSALETNGVRADTAFRDRIRSWVNLQLKDVESLAPYVARGLRKFHRTTLEDRHGAPAPG